MRSTASTEIRRSSEEVWRFIATEHRVNHPRWDPSVTRLEPLSDGAIGPGYRFRVTRRTMGRVETRDFTVVAWEPPAVFDIETRSTDMTLRVASRCERVDAETTLLTIGGEAQLRGPRALLAPLFRSRVDRDLRANLARIKSMIESRS